MEKTKNVREREEKPEMDSIGIKCIIFCNLIMRLIRNFFSLNVLLADF